MDGGEGEKSHAPLFLKKDLLINPRNVHTLAPPMLVATVSETSVVAAASFLGRPQATCRRAEGGCREFRPPVS